RAGRVDERVVVGVLQGFRPVRQTAEAGAEPALRVSGFVPKNVGQQHEVVVAHRAPPGYRMWSSAIAARYTAAIRTPTARSARARLKCAHASDRSSYSSGGSDGVGKASPLSVVLHHRVDAAPLGEVVRQPHRGAEVP